MCSNDAMKLGVRGKVGPAYATPAWAGPPRGALIAAILGLLGLLGSSCRCEESAGGAQAPNTSAAATQSSSADATEAPQSAADGPVPLSPSKAEPLWRRSPPQPMQRLNVAGPDVVTSSHGVVSSVEDQATQAGVEILEAGGNAVDAAVATTLALAVTHPSAGNLGGGGFLLAKMGDEVEAIDFREDSPAALTDEAFWKMIEAGGVGPASVGIPGTVAGLALAHERHGKLPWARLIEPALRLAREGYVLGARQHKTIGWSAAVLKYDPVAAAALLRGGRAPPVGTRIKRPKLAVALERIRARGAAGFYAGPTAADLVASLGETGLLSLDDLARYQARVRPLLWTDYRGFRVFTMPPPSAGGVALVQNLAMLERLDVHEAPLDSSRRLHLIAEANRRSQAERRIFVVAPETRSAQEREADRTRWLSADTWLAGHPIEPETATRSATLHELHQAFVQELEHTTHLSVVDGDGNLVSCTVTLSGSFGSRVFSRETGIVLNNSVASFSSAGRNKPAPAQRTISSMTPTLVWSPPDDWLVLGSPGGDTIPGTVTQVLLRLVNRQQSLAEAVRAPRIHQPFVPDQLWFERTRPLSNAQTVELARSGHRVVGGRSTIGDANVAAWTDSQAHGFADPREGGLALGAKDQESSAGP